MNNYSIKISEDKQESLKTFLSTKDVLFETMQYASFRAKGSGFVAILYNSGKFVLQGSDVTNLAQEIEEKVLGHSITVSQNEAKTDTDFVAHIGVDESGKGDVFGPLVVAGVYLDKNNYQHFSDIGIKDSKQLKDAQIKKMAIEIKNNAIFSVVTIKPEKYNILYNDFKNLNKLLAWGHARVIENILQKQNASYALCDKFGDESLIKNALMKEGKQIRLEQRTKAESDIAVACASVIARYEFVKNMQEMSSQIGIELPKGASSNVVQTGKTLIQKYDKTILNKVAKMHFKTIKEMIL